MDRKVTAYLEKWHKKTGRRPLIIDGPVGIGKTYEVRRLGASYDSFIEISFREHSEFIEVFASKPDLQGLILNITALIPGSRFIPARTLIFFDDVQLCPEIFKSLKIWNKEKRYDIILAGEYLGTKTDLKVLVSGGTKEFPTGVAEAIEMTSMDFEEFAWAKGICPEVISALQDCFSKGQEVMPAIHRRMMELVREYALVGGMPERVNASCEKNAESIDGSCKQEINTTEEVENTGDTEHKNQIVLAGQRLYQRILEDISVNCPRELRKKAEKCYMAIPPQLAKKNHKYQYSLLEDGGSARKYEESVKWLEEAHLITRTYNLSSLEYPPLKQSENFRVYPTDIGMLTAGLGDEFKNLLTHGDGLFEALAADMLYKRDHRGECFYNPKCDRIEMEFMLNTGHGFLPLDVKSGRKKNESLKHLIERSQISYGFRIGDKNIAVKQVTRSNRNLGNAGQIIVIPIYMLMFL